MNTLQPLYVSADIVTRNLQTPQLNEEQKLVVNDVFDIPDFDIPPQPQQQLPPPSQPQQQPSPAMTQSNFIKSINHNAMTDVMKQLAIQKQKTPSVTTKHTDVSVPMKSSAPPAIIHATTSPSSSSKDASKTGNQHCVPLGVVTSKKNKPRSSGALKNNVIVEEEGLAPVHA